MAGEINIDIFGGLWQQAKQELQGMWDSLSSLTESEEDKSIPVVKSIAKAIEQPEVPVVLEAGIFDDTTTDTTTDALGTEFNLTEFTDQLREHEGFRNKAYEDTEGHLTVGIGHKLSEGKVGDEFSEAQLTEFFEEDSASAIENAQGLVSNWDSLPTNAKHALSNMAFQLGKTGLSKFKDTLALVEAGNFKEASIEMLDSKWAKQTPNRAKSVAGLMASAASS